MRLRADRRDERRREADERNEEWRKLSPQEQFKQLGRRPGRSLRQIRKLKSLLEKGGAS